jgi:hypothetical protein
VPSLSHANATSIAYSPAAVWRLPAPIRNGIISAFAHSLHSVFLWAVPISALAFPALVLMRQLPLRSSAYIKSTGAGEAPPEVLDDEVLDEGAAPAYAMGDGVPRDAVPATGS